MNCIYDSVCATLTFGLLSSLSPQFSLNFKLELSSSKLIWISLNPSQRFVNPGFKQIIDWAQIYVTVDEDLTESG